MKCLLESMDLIACQYGPNSMNLCLGGGGGGLM